MQRLEAAENVHGLDEEKDGAVHDDHDGDESEPDVAGDEGELNSKCQCATQTTNEQEEEENEQSARKVECVVGGGRLLGVQEKRLFR